MGWRRTTFAADTFTKWRRETHPPSPANYVNEQLIRENGRELWTLAPFAVVTTFTICEPPRFAWKKRNFDCKILEHPSPTKQMARSQSPMLRHFYTSQLARRLPNINHLCGWKCWCTTPKSECQLENRNEEIKTVFHFLWKMDGKSGIPWDYIYSNWRKNCFNFLSLEGQVQLHIFLDYQKHIEN